MSGEMIDEVKEDVSVDMLDEFYHVMGNKRFRTLVGTSCSDNGIALVELVQVHNSPDEPDEFIVITREKFLEVADKLRAH